MVLETVPQLAIPPADPQEVPILAFYFGGSHEAGQMQRQLGIAQGLELPDTPLDLSSRGSKAGSMEAGAGQPVDGDTVLHALVQSLDGDMDGTMQKQRLHGVDGMPGFTAIGTTNPQNIPGHPDGSTGSEHMDNRRITIRGKESERSG